MTTASAIPVEVATTPDGAPSFAAVAEAHLDTVLRYLAHLTQNRDLAEDLTSATFERALRDWRRFDPRKGRVAVWLVQIARGVALDHFRSEGRRRDRERRYAVGEDEVMQPPEAGEADPRLRRALAGLTRAERELIALRVVLELDTGEAAAIAGLTPSAVSTGLHRALGKLRDEFGDLR
jgi:RNA polymerase sigma-70 factor (ECF subfamily)